MIRQGCTIQAAKAEQNDSQRLLLVCHVPAESTSGIVGRSGGTTTSSSCVHIVVPHRARSFINTLASRSVGSVVVAEACRLQDLHWQCHGELDVLSGDDRTHDQSQEDDEQDKVEDGVAHDTTLAKLCLLERVDGRTDLATVKR